MTRGRSATPARVTAVVLAALCVVAGVNTAFVVAHAVRERSGAVAGAALACTAVAAALGWGAARVWPGPPAS